MPAAELITFSALLSLASILVVAVIFGEYSPAGSDLGCEWKIGDVIISIGDVIIGDVIITDIGDVYR